MSVTTEELRFRGKSVFLPTTNIAGRTVVASGRLIKTAKLKDEEWLEGALVADLDSFVEELRRSGLHADILTFPGALNTAAVVPGVKSEADNVAVICTQDYKAWWDGLPQEARKNTRRAAKKGIVIRAATLDDDLAKGIKAIYDETPLRQGRPFWHYGKDIETIKRENSSYVERCQFIGAYFDGELVGFMKWVYVGDVARIMQILCLNAHQDKRPMIALIAKAAQMCHEQRMRYLIYGKFTYGKKTDSSITEFKRRLGFVQLDFSRYYIPLTWRGHLALRTGLHGGLIVLLPRWLVESLLEKRSRWLNWVTTREQRLSAPAADVETQ